MPNKQNNSFFIIVYVIRLTKEGDLILQQKNLRVANCELLGSSQIDNQTQLT